MNPRQLIQIVTLGLSLATASLTPAYGATAHVSPAEIKAARKRLMAHQQSIAKRDNVEALPIGLATKAIGKKNASESIEVIDSAMYVVQRQAGKITSQDNPTIADLHRFGLDFKAKFQQAVGRAMKNIAEEDLDK